MRRRCLTCKIVVVKPPKRICTICEEQMETEVTEMERNYEQGEIDDELSRNSAKAEST